MVKRSKRGFSLIEALVILLVTSILMAIILPVVTTKKQLGTGEKWSYSTALNIFMGTNRGSNNVGIGTTSPRARLHVTSAKQINRNTTADNQTIQEKGPDMLLEAPLRAAVMAFVMEKDGKDSANSSYLYMNAETDNIGLGEKSLEYNILHATSPNSQNVRNNLAMGFASLTNLRDIESGDDLKNNNNNVAIGYSALSSLQNGSNNTGIGAFNYAQCNDVKNNVVIAPIDPSEYANTDKKRACGSGNVLLGILANDIGEASNNSVIVSVENSSIIGYSTATGGGIQNGNGNLYIGAGISKNTGLPATSPYGSYNRNNDRLNIGDKILGIFSPNTGTDFSQEELFFNTSVFQIGEGNGLIFYRNEITSSSDSRLKKNITPFTRGIDDLQKVRVYNFFYKNDNKKDPLKVGIIAQDLQKIMPEAVYKKDDKKYYSVDYSYLNMAMVNAVKDIKKENDELNAELDALERRINSSDFQKKCVCKKESQSILDRLFNLVRFK